MKRLYYFIPLLIVSCTQTTKTTTEYFVYKNTMSNACKVQLPTERPLLGAKHLGPFATKEAAIKAMCKDVDDSMSDENRCYTVIPKDACK